MSNARNAKAVGGIFTHPAWGKVEVTAAVAGSFTLCEIKCIQRAEGWDENAGAYRVKRWATWNGDGTRTLHWKRRFVDQYGETDICHITELKPYHEKV